MNSLGNIDFNLNFVNTHLLGEWVSTLPYFLTTKLYAFNESMFPLDQIPINEQVIVITRSLMQK